MRPKSEVLKRIEAMRAEYENARAELRAVWNRNIAEELEALKRVSKACEDLEALEKELELSHLREVGAA